MGSRYQTNTASGYNSSPPADDGSQTAANLVTWAGTKTKLGDPIKTLAEDINSDLLTAFDYSVRQITASDSIAATDHMRTVEIAPTVTNAITVTLPDAATMTSNFIVRIRNSCLRNQTITRATGADTIDGTAGNVTIPALGSIIYTTNAAASGYLTVGASGPSVDSDALVVGGTDATKKLRFEVDGLTAGTRVLTPMDADYTVGDRINLATEQASTSSTVIDFAGIPAGVRRITLMLNAVSTNGTSGLMVQLGDADGIEATGYTGGVSVGTTPTAFTTGFGLYEALASGDTYVGQIILSLEDSSDFTWVATSNVINSSGANAVRVGAGRKALSAELTQVRLTMVNGTDAFDAGAVNISYER